jgi:hypothetical protein
MRVQLKPDHLYALLGNVVRLNPKLHITQGNEHALTMRIVERDALDKQTIFQLDSVISFDGVFSSVHFTTPYQEHQDILKDAVAEVIQMLVTYNSMNKTDDTSPSSQ